MAETTTDENSVDGEGDKEDLYKGYEHDYDRIERLFKDLDRNNDGKIDAEELAAGLKRLRVRHSKRQLKVGALFCVESLHLFIFLITCGFLYYVVKIKRRFMTLEASFITGNSIDIKYICTFK